MIKTLAKQIKEYKKDSILSPIYIAFEVVLELLLPFIMASMIDDGVEVGNMKHILITGSIMLVVAMLSLFCGAMCGKHAAIASTGFAKNVRKSMFDNIQTFSFANIDKFSTAGLITRMTTDVTNVQQAYQMIIRMCVRAPLMLITAMIMVVIINAKLALIYLVALIILGVALFFIISNARKAFMEMFKRYDDLNSSTQENINAIRVVKAYVREDHEISKFKKACLNLYLSSVKAEKLVILNSPIMMFVMYGSILLLSWLGAQMIVVGDLSTGNLSSMFTYSTNILMSLLMISVVIVMLTMSQASAERIVEVLNEKSTITNPENPVMKVKDGSICFESVQFSYNTDEPKYVLHEINLEIKAGETIGILGGTGSSKSSFVHMIPRLYDVTEGCVKVGGVNVKEYDLDVLRNEVAMVLQKNVLFSGSIKENLRWGNKEATDEEMIRACKLAQAHDFIESFPDKYDTHIEQGGTNVSGGQRQRLCIARALLKKPKILILDDSTSAVDTKTDAYIRKAFREEIPGTTKLIIAQRISSIQDADRIVVLNEGRIESVGTHEELLKISPIYQDVYNTQVKGGAEDGK
ncbi:MAG: ABC transporter ATP-binding protein [Lachnospiraceae bacterium]|nr:ABC transporter ATP-binding protein [Lachnospiraceae bacterium]